IGSVDNARRFTLVRHGDSVDTVRPPNNRSTELRIGGVLVGLIEHPWPSRDFEPRACRPECPSANTLGPECSTSGLLAGNTAAAGDTTGATGTAPTVNPALPPGSSRARCATASVCWGIGGTRIHGARSAVVRAGRASLIATADPVSTASAANVGIGLTGHRARNLALVVAAQ